MKNYAETKAQKQAHWLYIFGDEVVTLEPKFAGKIEWPSALHFFYQGADPKQAAKTYVENRRVQA